MVGKTIFNLFTVAQKRKANQGASEDTGFGPTSFELKVFIVFYLLAVASILACVFSLGK